MTEYELNDLGATYSDIAISALMGYFTVLSAYFIVAYAVGSALKRSQVIAVTGLFLVMALFMTWGRLVTFGIPTICVNWQDLTYPRSRGGPLSYLFC